ncbi:MAG: alpha/beta hydrolase [Anaerolineales bacterium]|nr:alpha/beta hydrolase [Anaerolineales bacterium]
MTPVVDRAAAIRQGRRLRRLQMLHFRLRSLSRLFRKGPAREVHIETSAGRVRTLWYGFDNPSVAPLFIDLHGGGFILGNPEMDEAINLQFCQQVGCKVISIDYAKAPEHPFPAAVDQVYAVAQHLVAHAAEYGIDAARIGIGGHSAGANLATVACLKAAQEGDFQFVCQLLDYPPLDLGTSPFAKPNPQGGIPPKVAQMFDSCYVDPAEARHPYVSPVYADPADLAQLPPALLIVAGHDSLHDEGVRYAEMLRAAGVPATCHDYPNAAHGFTLKPSADTTDALAKMVAFLREYLADVRPRQ